MEGKENGGTEKGGKGKGLVVVQISFLSLLHYKKGGEGKTGKWFEQRNLITFLLIK